jgi:multiple sugar transport system substrate-binding protein
MAVTEVELRGVTWDHERGIGGLRAAAAAYRERRPDVGVRWTVRSLQAFAHQPLEELGRRFDLLYVDHPSIGEAVSAECLVPLDRHIDPAVVEDQLASSVGRSAESYLWDGHRWALATDVAAQVAVYREDLLERAGLELPRTWPDALETAAALRRHGMWAAIPAIPVDAICSFLAVCMALGEEPLAEPVGVISVETGRRALRLLADLVSRCHPGSLEWNPPAVLERMSSTDEIAYCPLAFGYANYARAGFRAHVVRAGPPPAGEDGVPRGTLGGAGLAVSSESRAVDEAVAFAAFVADPEIQRGPYFEGGGQPGHRTAWTDPGLNASASGFFRETLEAVEAAYLRPRYDGFVGFQRAAGALVHGFLRDHSDPRATLSGIDDAHRASMASRLA